MNLFGRRGKQEDIGTSKFIDTYRKANEDPFIDLDR